MDMFKKYLLSSVAMSPDDGGAPATTESAPAPAIDNTPVHKAGGDGPLSVRDAARSLIDWRHKGSGQEPAQTNTAADASADTATSGQSESDPAQAGEDNGGESPPVETESQDAATETLPPVVPPRSWSKEDKELFKALPRETQERLADRERSRDTDFSKRQQEATERARALQAEHAKVESARSQYEQALPILLDNLQTTYGNEFADIRTMDDVQKLAVSDPIRYTQWDASQKRMAAVQQEVVAGQQRQQAERAQSLNAYRTREAELFVEKAPEFSDPVQSKKMMDSAVTTLRDLGFADQELGELYRGEKDISIHDHRFALVLKDAIKYRDMQAQARRVTANAKPLPPVQRPGAGQGPNAAHAARINDLNKQIDNSRGNNALRAAAALLQERRRAR